MFFLCVFRDKLKDDILQNFSQFPDVIFLNTAAEINKRGLLCFQCCRASPRLNNTTTVSTYLVFVLQYQRNYSKISTSLYLHVSTFCLIIQYKDSKFIIFFHLPKHITLQSSPHLCISCVLYHPFKLN